VNALSSGIVRFVLAILIAFAVLMGIAAAWHRT
jgi:hypothetical protein